MGGRGQDRAVPLMGRTVVNLHRLVQFAGAICTIAGGESRLNSPDFWELYKLGGQIVHFRPPERIHDLVRPALR